MSAEDNKPCCEFSHVDDMVISFSFICVLLFTLTHVIFEQIAVFIFSFELWQVVAVLKASAAMRVHQLCSEM